MNNNKTTNITYHTGWTRTQKIEYIFKNNLQEKYKDQITLQDYETYLATHEHLTNITCPVCYNSVKRYKRSINKNLVEFLISLCNLMSTKLCTYHYYKDIQNKQSELFNTCSTDYSLLKLFDLIVEEKKGTGFFTLTNKGIAFLRSNINIEEYIITLGGRVIERSKEHVNIYHVKDDIIELKKERRPF